MDLDGATYETFEDLKKYCKRVASATGLALIEVFGYDDKRAVDYAVDLGIALQLTNILRDITEDLEIGRIYLCLIYTSPRPRDATLTSKTYSA